MGAQHILFLKYDILDGPNLSFHAMHHDFMVQKFSFNSLCSRLCTTYLWAEYTWLSKSLYWPKVAVHTVHLYERCAGFSVFMWSLATWFNSFHWYTWFTRIESDVKIATFLREFVLTFPQTGHLPLSCPLLAASCMLAVTNPWLPNKCRSKPWSVKNRNWHFWQFKGGRL